MASNQVLVCGDESLSRSLAANRDILGHFATINRHRNSSDEGGFLCPAAYKLNTLVQHTHSHGATLTSIPVRCHRPCGLIFPERRDCSKTVLSKGFPTLPLLTRGAGTSRSGWVSIKSSDGTCWRLTTEGLSFAIANKYSACEISGDDGWFRVEFVIMTIDTVLWIRAAI
jgi:hypothetical protein